MKARLLESHELAPEIRHFTFEVPEVSQLTYQAGQFVSFTAERGDKQITRAYSICSPPSGNQFELCLNRVEDGRLSPLLFSLEPGQEIDIKGPLGAFVWREPVRDSVLVATGTGIAPMRGLLHHLLPDDREHRFTLVFGVRYESNILYRAEFECLAREYPNFTFLPVVSRPSDTWTGLTGHVQEPVLASIGDRRDIDVYICGMKAMVDDLRTRLKALGFDRRQIVYEKYD